MPGKKDHRDTPRRRRWNRLARLGWTAFISILLVPALHPGAASAANPTLTNPEQRIFKSNQICQGGENAVTPGGTINTRDICLEVFAADADLDQVRVEFEVKKTSETFDGTGLFCWPEGQNCAAFGNQGGKKIVHVSGLTYGTGYKWRVQVRDSGGTDGWTLFGTGDPDFLTLNVKPTISSSSVVQRDPGSNGVCQSGDTAIAQNGQIGKRSICFEADPEDSPGNKVRFEVEVKATGVGFNNTSNHCYPTACQQPITSYGPSDYTTAGTNRIKVTGLVYGTNYHWQVRAIDDTGLPGDWVSFGTNSDPNDPDFRVVNAAPTIDSLEQRVFLGICRHNETPVIPGGTIDTLKICIEGDLTDDNPVKLEVEVADTSTGFTGTATASSAFGGSGVVAIPLGSIVSGTDYHWQARAVDDDGLASHTGTNWLAFGTDSSPPPYTVDFHVSDPSPTIDDLAQGDPIDSTCQTGEATSNPIALGGNISNSVICLQAHAIDATSVSVRLEVELKEVTSNFDGTVTYCKPDCSSYGSQGDLFVQATIADGTGYHWRARVRDDSGQVTSWFNFANTGAPPNDPGDLTLHFSRGNDPPTISNLRQQDPLTTICQSGKPDVAEGGPLHNLKICLGADVSDTNSIRLEVEVKEFGTPFDNSADFCKPSCNPNDFIAAQASLQVTATGLQYGTEYHWQARAIDVIGAPSGGNVWTEFGLIGNFDFVTENADPLVTDLQQRDPGSSGICLSGKPTVDFEGPLFNREICLGANPQDGANDQVRLEIELKEIGTPFDYTADKCWPGTDCTITYGDGGNIEFLKFTSLNYGTGYHWQARVVDEYGGCEGAPPGCWVEFGGNPDFTPTNTDPVVSAPEQRNPGLGDTCQGTDSVVNVGELSYLRKTICLEANVADPGNDKVRLEFELRPIGTPFSDAPNYCWPAGTDCLTYNNGGATKQIDVSPLEYGTSYHWQVRAVDEFGGASSWISFGSNTENPPTNPAAVDFRVINDVPVVTNPGQFVDDDNDCNNGTGGAVSVGGSIDKVSICMQADITDANAQPIQTVQLEIEVRKSTDPFLNTRTQFTTLSGQGTHHIRVTSPTIQSDTDYHWQYRVLDDQGLWNAFGTNGWIPFSTGTVDFHVNNHKPVVVPAGFDQFRNEDNDCTNGGDAQVLDGGDIENSSICLQFQLDDPDNNAVRFEVEVQEMDTSFDDTAFPPISACNPAICTGFTGEGIKLVQVDGLVAGKKYKWRARGVDDRSTNNVGDWEEFPTAEGAGDYDFFFNNFPPAITPVLQKVYEGDCSTSVTTVDEQGKIDETTICLEMGVNDTNGNYPVTLEIEVHNTGTSLSGTLTDSQSVLFTSTVRFEVSSLVYNTTYHWQYQATDATGLTTGWVEFGTPGVYDFEVEDLPPVITAVNQYDNDGDCSDGSPTTVAEGDTLLIDSICFGATVTDPDTELVRLEVELIPTTSSFLCPPTGACGTVLSSATVPAGSTVYITAPGLLFDTGYRWRYRAVDFPFTTPFGETSAWEEFATDGVTDFFTNNIPPSVTTAQQREFDGLCDGGETTVSEGGTILQRDICLEAAVSDGNPAQTIQLEIEVQDALSAFTGTASTTFTGLTSGDTVRFNPGGVGDGLTVYNQSGAGNPRLRFYSGGTNLFGAELPTASSGVPEQIRVATSPNKREAIAVYDDGLNTVSSLRVLCYDGKTWISEWNDRVVGTGSTQRFDVAYEKASGDVLVAYTDGDSQTNISYRTKPGSLGCGSANWSSEQTFNPARTGGNVWQVRLVPDNRPESNTIAMAWSDSANDLSAANWDGDADGFVNEPGAVTEASLDTASTRHNFDLAYESVSGDLLLIWGNTTTTEVKYRTCTGAVPACTWNAVTDTTFEDDGTHVSLSANPLTDEMIFASVAGVAADLQGGYWDGNSWTIFNNLDTSAQSPTATGLEVATGWLTSGSTTRGVVTYAKSGAGNNDRLTYFVLNPTVPSFSAQQAFAPSILWSIPRFMSIAMDPSHSDRMMLTLSDNNNDIFAKRAVLSGSTVVWSNADGGRLETNASIATERVVDFAYFSGLAYDDFKWRYRATDSAGATTGWIEFLTEYATNATPDFTTQNQPPTISTVRQRIDDGSCDGNETTVGEGNSILQTSICMSAQLGDTNTFPTQPIHLEVEVYVGDTSPGNLVTAGRGITTDGGTANVRITGLNYSTSYLWRYRAVDRYGLENTGSWDEFETDGTDDFTPINAYPTFTAGPEQYRHDGTCDGIGAQETPIGENTNILETGICIHATMDDANTQPTHMVTLEVEVYVDDTSGSPVATGNSGVPVDSGTPVFVPITGLAYGSDYVWRYRAVDSSTRPDGQSPWVEYGTAGVIDFTVVNDAPVINLIDQTFYDGDCSDGGGLSIPEDENIADQSVCIESNITDANNLFPDQAVQLDVEVRENSTVGPIVGGVPFTSGLVAQGPIRITVTGLSYGTSYFWRYRAVDEEGLENVGSWEWFGTDSLTDFTVQNFAPVINSIDQTHYDSDCSDGGGLSVSENSNIKEKSLCIESNITDESELFTQKVKLEVEVRENSTTGPIVGGVPFTSGLVDQGDVRVTVTGLSYGTSYFWRYRAVDSQGQENTGSWEWFGTDSLTDFSVENVPPFLQSGEVLQQELDLDLTCDGDETTVADGATVLDSNVCFSAHVTDDNIFPDQTIALEIEVQPRGTLFECTGLGSCSSTWLRRGTFVTKAASIVTVKYSALSSTSYHWQYRFVDSDERDADSFSAWSEVDTGPQSPDFDFRIEVNEPPTIDPDFVFQKVYDGNCDGSPPTVNEDGIVLQTAICLEAQLDDVNSSDSITLEIEVQEAGTAFTNTATYIASPVSPGTPADVFVGKQELAVGNLGGVPDANLVGLWHFNANEGRQLSASGTCVLYHLNNSLTDSCTSPLTLSLAGNATVTAAAKFDRGATFDGTNDALWRADTTGSKFDLTTQFTLEAWVKTVSAADTEDVIIGKENEYLLSVVSGTLRYALRTAGTWAYINTGLSVPAGKWTHVALTYNGSTVIGYVDGVPDPTPDTDPDGGALDQNNNRFCIGARNTSCTGGDFNGQIDEVAIFKGQVLSGATIQDHYRRGVAEDYSNEDLSAFEPNDGETIGVASNAAGNLNGALLFDGVDDYVWVNPNVHGAVNGLTLEAWVFPTAGGTIRSIFDKYNSPPTTDREYLMRLEANDELRFWVGHTNGTAAVSCGSGAGTVPINEWTHVVATWDGTDQRLYLNGQLANTCPQAITHSNNRTTTLQIGRYSTGNVFSGRIDEAAIFNTALTAAQVTTHYIYGSGLEYGKDYVWQYRAFDSQGLYDTGGTDGWVEFGTEYGTNALPDFKVRNVAPTFTEVPKQYDYNGSCDGDETTLLEDSTILKTNVCIEAVVTDDNTFPDQQVQLEIEVHEGSSTGPVFASLDTGFIVKGSPAQITISGLTYGTSYFWRYRAVDDTGRLDGETTWTWFGTNSVADFTVQNNAPTFDVEPDQFEYDGTCDGTQFTVIENGSILERSLCIEATINDDNIFDDQEVQLEVEVREGSQGGPLFGNFNSGFVTKGTPARITVSGLSYGISYFWQYRAVDNSTRPDGETAWTWFGTDSVADFNVVNDPPTFNVTADQFIDDDGDCTNGTGANIADGDTIFQTSICFKATIDDANTFPPNQVRLEIEVFVGNTTPPALYSNNGPYVDQGTVASARISGLSFGTKYLWRYRAVDSEGLPNGGGDNGWFEYETAPPEVPEYDFEVAGSDPSILAAAQRPYDGNCDGSGSPLPESSDISQRNICVEAQLEDLNTIPPQTIRLEVEVKEAGTPFDDTATLISTAVADQETARIRIGAGGGTKQLLLGDLGPGVLDTDLLGLWHFDENEGVQLPNPLANSIVLWHLDGNGTSAVGGPTAVATNGATYTGAGKFKQSGSFAGDDDYLDGTDIVATDGLNKLSVEFWMKAPVQTNSFVGLVAKAQDTMASASWAIREQNTNDALLCQIVNASQVLAGGVINNVFDDAWHHIVMTYDGSNIRCYKDGALAAGPIPQTGNIQSTALSVTVGSYDATAGGNFTARAYDGLIDEVVIYSQPLDPLTVNANFRRGILEDHTDYDPDSFEANDGQITGPVSSLAKFGEALSFDGVNDYVEMGDVLDFNGSQSFTIEGWISHDDTNPTFLERIVSKRPSGATPKAGYRVGITPLSNYVIAEIDDGTTTVSATSPSPVTNGSWTHFAVVVDRTDQTMVTYINGVPGTPADISLVGDLSNALPLRFGSISNDPAASFFDGLMDEVAIFNIALSDDQITDHYQRGNGFTLDYGKSYIWQYRAVDSSGQENTGSWEPFESDDINIYDFKIINNNPTITSSTLNQYDGPACVPAAVMGLGDSVADSNNRVCFQGDVQDTNTFPTQQVELEVEVEQVGSAYSNSSYHFFSSLSNQGLVGVTSNFPGGSYRWRARGVDDASLASTAWTEFGTNDSLNGVDFVIACRLDGIIDASGENQYGDFSGNDGGGTATRFIAPDSSAAYALIVQNEAQEDSTVTITWSLAPSWTGEVTGSPNVEGGRAYISQLATEFEIIGDSIGNDDGVCDGGEDCFLGADDGGGGFCGPAETCTATVTVSGGGSKNYSFVTTPPAGEAGESREFIITMTGSSPACSVTDPDSVKAKLEVLESVLISPANLFVAQPPTQPGSDTRLNLSWTDKTPNETGFKVYRAIESGDWTPTAPDDCTGNPALVLIATIFSDAAQSLGLDGTVYYADSGLAPGTKYCYFVEAFIRPSGAALDGSEDLTGGNGTQLKWNETTTPAAEADPPNTVTDLEVVPESQRKDAISLTWTAPFEDSLDPTSGPAKEYVVRYSMRTIKDGGAVPPDEVNFDDVCSDETAAARPLDCTVEVLGTSVPQNPGDTEVFTLKGRILAPTTGRGNEGECDTTLLEDDTLTAGPEGLCFRPNTNYYFAMKSKDSTSPQNTSALSNVAGGDYARDTGTVTSASNTPLPIVEILGDGSGNDDGICESGEACIQAPPFAQAELVDTTKTWEAGSWIGARLAITGVCSASGQVRVVVQNSDSRLYLENSWTTLPTGSCDYIVAQEGKHAGRTALRTGLNMVSIPYTPVPTDPQNVFGDDVGAVARMFQWNSSGLLETDGCYGASSTVEEIGTATGSTGSTLTDSSKINAWTTDEWVGYEVTITSGTGIGDTHVISGNNTFGVLDISPDTWSANPDEDYVIHGPDQDGDVTSSTPASLTDSSQSWQTNEFSGSTVLILTGAQAVQSHLIMSNSADTLFVTAFDDVDGDPENLPDAIDAGSHFVILQSESTCNPPEELESLVPGLGYFLIGGSNNPVIDAPAGSTDTDLAAVSPPGACGSVSQNVIIIPIDTDGSGSRDIAEGWHVVGNPFPGIVTLDDPSDDDKKVWVIYNRGIGGEGCESYRDAVAAGNLDGGVYEYNGVGYAAVNCNGPSCDAIFEPWKAYWIYVINNTSWTTIELVVPKP